ncbi:MAG: glycosyltransferase [bacterium]|nr:glycosyltransferase [bacterium]
MELILLILYVLPLTVIFGYSMVQLHLTINYLRFHKKKPTAPPQTIADADLPVVTVQLPIFNEMYVVERLIDNIARFNYPAEKLEIQVLDDSTDETVEISRNIVEEWRQKGLDIHLLTREERTGYKAGALHEGLKKARGEFIAIFDADFLPSADFLKKTLPYLMENREIGAVQTRWEHLNRDFSILTKIQAFALDAHFTVEQQGRNAGGYFINFNGTAGVWRRECIDDAGGWHIDTLTEDLDLSYRAQIKGWKFKYLEDFSSPAELPMAMNAVKSQQFRWTKGGAETVRKNFGLIWKSDISPGQKIHGTAHLMGSSIFICVLLCSLLSVPMLIVKSNPLYADYFVYMSVFIISLLSLGLFYFCSVYRRSKGFFRAVGKLLAMFPVFLSMSMGISLHNTVAVFEGLIGIKSPFIRTPKFNVSGQGKNWKKNKYLNRGISVLTLLEGFLALYFIGGIGLSVYLGDYSMMPFYLMLTLGFGMVFYFSLKHSMR